MQPKSKPIIRSSLVRTQRKGPARRNRGAHTAKLKAASEVNILAQEKRMRGRPPYEPTQKDRDFVISMVEHGANHDEIAAVIGVSDETLRRHCGFELQRGLIKAHADVARTLLMRAVGGPTRDWTKASDTALIFYAKTRMKYVEPAREIEIPDLRVESLSDRQLNILLERIVARRSRSLLGGETEASPERLPEPREPPRG
jgi:hypothetical protein